ncbi:MAG: class SAM-dependent methyltransferase [Frankiales bacterium]|nr:class SAM-dependent methyltransferase [Frankiales bacterium]
MESPVQRLRRGALGAGDKVVARVARASGTTQRQATGVDLAVAAVLQDRGTRDLHDPASFVELLRTCWEPLTLDVEDSGGDQLLFSALVDHLRTGVAPLPVDISLAAAEAADRLLAARTPYDRSALMTDVGSHARWSSSFGHSARFLTAVVRCLRARTVVEVGTAYGLGALFLSDALARGQEPGRLVTIEAGEPQKSLSAGLLADRGNVTTIRGRTPDVLPEVFAQTGPVDFLFHDGDHSKDAYVADFEASLPHLAAGAVVVFDDIRWEDPFALRDVRTAEGWEIVSAHPRVARRAEVGGRYGLLMLA